MSSALAPLDEQLRPEESGALVEEVLSTAPCWLEAHLEESAVLELVVREKILGKVEGWASSLVAR